MKQFCGFQIKIIDFPLGAEFFAFVTPGIDNFISTSMESINSWQTFNEDAQCRIKVSTIFCINAVFLMDGILFHEPIRSVFLPN